MASNLHHFKNSLATILFLGLEPINISPGATLNFETLSSVVSLKKFHSLTGEVLSKVWLIP